MKITANVVFSSSQWALGQRHALAQMLRLGLTCQ